MYQKEQIQKQINLERVQGRLAAADMYSAYFNEHSRCQSLRFNSTLPQIPDDEDICLMSAPLSPSNENLFNRSIQIELDREFVEDLREQIAALNQALQDADSSLGVLNRLQDASLQIYNRVSEEYTSCLDTYQNDNNTEPI